MQNTERFSDRVANYLRYRPGYPPDLLPFLTEELRLPEQARIADIGSGTGKLAELFARSYRVTGVEPNDEMRAAGERMLGHYPNFTSVNGTAEHTTLAPESVDWIVAGQAFHWFDAGLAKQEFERILVKRGTVALIWNERETDSPFLADYEAFLRRFTTDYRVVDHRNLGDAVFEAFFGPERYALKTFGNHQYFDLEGLIGRYQSSSYAYPENHPAYGEAVRELRRLFEAHQRGGQVRFDYLTKLYYGRLSDR